jgi:hypothetical protein
VTTIRRLVGVYDADHTVWGELRYFVGARLGRTHCALCDITHGLVRERHDWKTSRAGLRVAFDTFHRDDQPDPIRVATADTAPVVVAETAAGVVMLLGPSELDACAGSPERLVASIDAAVQRSGLSWPTG